MAQTPRSRPRWTSRKFLMTVSAQVTAMVVLMWPGQESAIVEASMSITSLLVVLLTSLGYVISEAAIDARRASADPGAQAP